MRHFEHFLCSAVPNESELPPELALLTEYKVPDSHFSQGNVFSLTVEVVQ